MSNNPLPSVAGRMEMTHETFQNACQVELGRLQEDPNCDTRLVYLLCEAVRCSRECCELAQIRSDASQAEVRPIVEALQRMDSLLEKMFAATWGKNFSLPTQEINEAFSQSRKALGVAREHGLLEQPRNKPCSKCGSRMQVSYGEPDNKEIVPPHWWCRHCGHEEDKP